MSGGFCQPADPTSGGLVRSAPSGDRAEPPPSRPRPSGAEAPARPPSPELGSKGELTSDLWVAGSLLVCALQLLGLSALPAALAALAVLLVAAALVL